MILVNGEQRETIDVRDRGLAYGDGLFETIRVAAGQPVLLDRHLRRLERGADVLGMALHEAIDEVRGDIAGMLAGTEAVDAVIKVIVTRGVGGRGYPPTNAGPPTRIVSIEDYSPVPASRDDGIDVYLCNTRLAHNPGLAGIKHLNRLEQVLAAAEVPREYGEGLVCDHAGHVIEGTRSNVFLLRDATLVTPALDGCGVAGVMRELLIDIAAVELADVELQTLLAADEVFMANSVFGIYPVRSVTVDDKTTRYRSLAGAKKVQSLVRETLGVAL